MTKTGRIGRVTAACDDGRVYVLFGSSDYPENMQASDLEPVSDSCHFTIGDKVRATGKSLTFGDCVEGKIGEIASLCTFNGVKCADVRWGSGRENVIPLIQLTKCDPCVGCQKLDQTRLKAFWEGKAEGEHAADRKLEVMEQNRDAWKATAKQNCRNAFYWREELTKLQKEALAECKPLAEAVKIYIRVSPEELERILKGRD
jgi:hypothetical protein